MSWEKPTEDDGSVVRVTGDDGCPWCDGTGHYKCTPGTKPDHAGDHRPWATNVVAHRCGQCAGTGKRR